MSLCGVTEQTYLLNLNSYVCLHLTSVSKSSFPSAFMPQTASKRITFALAHHLNQYSPYNVLRFESPRYLYKDAVRKQYFTRAISFLLKVKKIKILFPHIKACKALQKGARKVSFPPFFFSPRHFFLVLIYVINAFHQVM